MPLPSLSVFELPWRRRTAAQLGLAAACACAPAVALPDVAVVPLETPRCAARALLEQFSSAPEQEAPRLPARSDGAPALQAYRIGGAGLALDGWRYSVLLDARSGQAWLLRSGGLNGAWQWHGPVALADGQLQSCAPDAQMLAVLNSRPS